MVAFNQEWVVATRENSTLTTTESAIPRVGLIIDGHDKDSTTLVGRHWILHHSVAQRLDTARLGMNVRRGVGITQLNQLCALQTQTLFQLTRGDSQ